MELPFKLSVKFPKEYSFGLDIGNSMIKFVTLKFIKDKVELCDFYLEPNQPNLTEVLKRMAQSSDIKRGRLASVLKCGLNLSVTGPSTIIRYVIFPKMSDAELKKALEFEAQKHIPFSIDEVNIDNYILRQDLPDNKMLVMLAAAKKEFISQRLQLLQEAGLNANTINMDSIALINAFNFNYSQDDSLKAKTIALLDIGAALSSLNILEGDTPCLSRDIPIGGNNFTRNIADIFGLDPKSAEELKLNPDKERLDKVSGAIELILSNLAQEVRGSFDYYESQSTSSVVKIFLSGGSSLFAGLKDMLADLLGIEVEYWDPLKAINISERVDLQKVKAVSSRLSVAIGSALS